MFPASSQASIWGTEVWDDEDDGGSSSGGSGGGGWQLFLYGEGGSSRGGGCFGEVSDGTWGLKWVGMEGRKELFISCFITATPGDGVMEGQGRVRVGWWREKRLSP